VNYWLIIVRERTFMEILERGVYGCSDPHCGLLMTRVRRGDRLVVFVSGFGCKSYCKSFTAILEVVGDWAKAKVGNWTGVVDVKPIALGRVELGTIANKLGFVRGRKNITEALHSVDPTNPRATPIPTQDAELIMGEMRRQAEPRPATEILTRRETREAGEEVGRAAEDIEKLIRELAEIGQILGYHPITNYDTGTYKLTQAWWGSKDEYEEGLAPLAVFETTQNTEQALAKLKHARDKWRGVKTYLITLRPEDTKEIEKALKGSFHELKNKIKTITKEEIEQTNKDLTKHKETIKELTSLRQD
jgi:predicted RNA-binding protein/DNA-binding Lrp family transcriptional regulator